MTSARRPRCPDFTDADLERLAQERMAQGLPRKLEDPEVARKIAVLLAAPFERRTGST